LIWKKYLERHLFRGTNMLADYPQVDHSLRQIYPGQNYYSLNNTVLNIGVVYHDVNGIKYAGYRQLSISYIPDLSRPDDGWRTVMVSSSGIKTGNGVVATLVKENVEFGFDVDEFFNDVAASKEELLNDEKEVPIYRVRSAYIGDFSMQQGRGRF